MGMSLVYRVEQEPLTAIVFDRNGEVDA